MLTSDCNDHCTLCLQFLSLLLLLCSINESSPIISTLYSQVWDLEDLICIRTYEAHTRPTHAVAARPDNSGMFATASFDTHVTLWDTVVNIPALSKLHNNFLCCLIPFTNYECHGTAHQLWSIKLQGLNMPLLHLTHHATKVSHQSKLNLFGSDQILSSSPYYLQEEGFV